MRQSKTHFEQIPVDTVKKMVETLPERQSELMSDDSCVVPEITYPQWQPQVLAALTELNRGMLEERINAAEITLLKRWQAISRNPDHEPERIAIQDALASLRSLKRIEFEDSTRQEPRRCSTMR